jgi:hypothetical protein
MRFLNSPTQFEIEHKKMRIFGSANPKNINKEIHKLGRFFAFSSNQHKSVQYKKNQFTQQKSISVPNFLHT